MSVTYIVYLVFISHLECVNHGQFSWISNAMGTHNNQNFHKYKNRAHSNNEKYKHRSIPVIMLHSILSFLTREVLDDQSKFNSGLG